MVSYSSTKAKYLTINVLVCEMMWIRYLLQQIETLLSFVMNSIFLVFHVGVMY